MAELPRKKRKSGIPTGNAGEYLVMGELLRRGYDAQLADRNTQGYDLLVGRPGHDRLQKVQVKTVRLQPWFIRVSELSVDFDLEATGFEAPEIDLRILSLDEETLDAADDFENAKGVPVTRPGDCWVLNDHFICCGSALDPTTYAAFPSEYRAAAVFTDPPYNVPIKGHVSGLGKITHREFAQASGEMTPETFTEFLTNALRLARDHSRDIGLSRTILSSVGGKSEKFPANRTSLGPIELSFSEIGKGQAETHRELASKKRLQTAVRRL
jgi:hypothetical protein